MTTATTPTPAQTAQLMSWVQQLAVCQLLALGRLESADNIDILVRVLKDDDNASVRRSAA